FDGAPVGHHLLDHRDEHRHPEVLERPGVGVAALLHPQLVEAQRVAEAVGPEQVRAALVHRDDVLVADLGTDPLLLAPDRRSVGPRRALVSLVEQPHPRRRAAIAQRLDVVADLEQIAAGGAVVDRLRELVLAMTAGDAAEDGAVGHWGIIDARAGCWVRRAWCGASCLVPSARCGAQCLVTGAWCGATCRGSTKH